MLQPDPTPQDTIERPTALHEHAAANLRFIRATMEGATMFTGLSGKGYAVTGISAIGAAVLAAQQNMPLAWLTIWLLELVLAIVLCLGFMLHKAQRQGLQLWSTSSRRLLYAFAPVMLAGALLTLALVRTNTFALLPGTWLALYGAAVISGGMHSVPAVSRMGLAFLALGACGLLVPIERNLLLGIGFGGLHLLFGSLIWRQHGG